VGNREFYTLFGSWKEFSSITLSDVRIVMFDPDDLIAFCNPEIEMAMFTVSLPKFTIYKTNFRKVIN